MSSLFCISHRYLVLRQKIVSGTFLRIDDRAIFIFGFLTHQLILVSLPTAKVLSQNQTSIYKCIFAISNDILLQKTSN